VIRGLEILELRAVGDFWQARTALDGRLAIPFEFPKQTRAEYATDEAFEAFLLRQTRTLLDAWGDARDQRPEPAGEFVV
jgi:hypothetical protein